MINSRKISDLLPELQPKFQAFLDVSKDAEIDLLVTSTYRDFDSQQALYSRGRTTPGEPCHCGEVLNQPGTCKLHPQGFHVTMARAGRRLEVIPGTRPLPDHRRSNHQGSTRGPTRRTRRMTRNTIILGIALLFSLFAWVSINDQRAQVEMLRASRDSLQARCKRANMETEAARIDAEIRLHMDRLFLRDSIRSIRDSLNHHRRIP